MSAGDWAMVTGASSGIGRTVAITLAERGWNVGLHCRQSLAQAEEVARAVLALQRDAFVLQADLANETECEPLVADAWHRSGGVKAWLHFAGVDILTGEFAKLSFDEKLTLTVQVDLLGTIRVARSVGQRMRQAGGGSIVTVGWDQSATGMEGDSGEIFASAKGGVSAFTRSLSRSLAPTVRVNCVAPGWIKTAWGASASEGWQERVLRETPLKRWGSPTDVSAVSAFLVSDEAAFLTGQTILVNGGVVTS
jgi:3-oxoacyl-[acyl-carrier protein] reductase